MRKRRAGSNDFDAIALYEAMDRQRINRGLIPESFLSVVAANVDGTALPSAGSNRRLRWDLRALYDALDSRRRERQLTWAELAGQLRCGANQLTGIKTVRFAIRMTLAMRIVQWLERPASAFIYVADW